MKTDQSTNQSLTTDSPDVAGCPAPVCSGLRFVRDKFDAVELHKRPALDLSDGYCGIRDTLRLQVFDGNEWVDVPIVSQNND